MDFLSYWVYLTLLLHWKSPQHHVGIIRVGIITNITSSGTQLAIIISVNADIKHLPVHYDASLNQPTVHPCQVQPHHYQAGEVELWMQPEGCEEEEMRRSHMHMTRMNSFLCRSHILFTNLYISPLQLGVLTTIHWKDTKKHKPIKKYMIHLPGMRHEAEDILDSLQSSMWMAASSWANLVSKFICWVSGLFRLVVLAVRFLKACKLLSLSSLFGMLNAVANWSFLHYTWK